LIKNLQDKKHEVIIGGDFNKHKSVDNVLYDLTYKHNMVDIITAVGTPYTTSYRRGNQLLDKIFVSPNLVTPATQARFKEYDKITITNHRPIQLQLTIHKNIKLTENYNQRQLNSNHLFQVKTYIEKVHKEMEKQKIFQAVNDIQSNHDIETALNQIDYKITNIRLKAEKSLKSCKRNWWHKDLIVWKKDLQQCNKKLKHLNKTRPKPHDKIQKLLQEKNCIVTKFHNHTEHGYQRRQKMIQDNISELYQEDPPNKEKIKRLKTILCNEHVREIYSRIRKKSSDPRNMQLKIQVAKDNGSMDTYTDPEVIADHIANYNMQHFSQAKHTPLASISQSNQQPQDFDTNHRLENQQSYSQTKRDISAITQQFIENISKNPAHIGTDTVAPEEWIKRFKRWKETTTTSPSGLHLGHYKALFSPHTFSFEEESKQKQDLDCKQQELLEVTIELFNIATQNAISLNRWKTFHSIALHKDKDSYLVN
jgi:hypothetical protein